ncbi:MAG: S53 family peptidase [Gemmatimonadota bacterium]
MIQPHRALAGSSPVHPPGAVDVAAADPDRRIQVTVVLKRPRLPNDHPALVKAKAYGAAWPTERSPMGIAEFTALYAPPAAVVRAILGIARKEGLTIVDVSAARHDVVLEGPIGAFDRACRIRQREYQHELGRYRAHGGPIKLPGQVAALVEGVLGLDTIPHARPHARPARPGSRSLTPAEIAKLYRFPPATRGAGRIAVLEFGGGIHAEDLRALARTAPIRVLEITDGAGESPGNSPVDGPTLLAIRRDWRSGMTFEQLAAKYGTRFQSFMDTVEATMDAQIVCSLMPDTAVDLVFSPPSADGWRRAIYAEIGLPYPGSVSGPASRSRKPASVISCSWGMAESSWGRMKLRVLHGTIKAAGRRGATVCCSTGDFGSRNSPRPSPKRSVNYPATSTWSLACGGLSFRDDERGRCEVTWLESLLGTNMAGGGGMSGHFPKPPFQAGVSAPKPGDTWLAGTRRSFKGRWIPDVAAHAGFDPGVAMSLLGKPFVGGGTSAATPIWAALVARLSAQVGRPLGWLTPALYQLAESGAFRDIREGHNDLAVKRGKPVYYRATIGWDACTGLGAPDGTALLEGLRKGPSEIGNGKSAVGN